MIKALRQTAVGMLALSFITASAITLPDLPDIDGMAVKGYVHDGIQPLEGVHVSDGISITTTGADGSYYLPSDNRAEMVFVITPSGYIPACANGLGRFWSKIDTETGVTRADFALTATGDDTNHKMIVLGDPQMRDDHDHGIFKADALPDIKATVNALKEDGVETGVLVLGDMCFNNPETYPRYASYWYGFNTPMYHVPGNHDKHLVTDIQAQAPEYKTTFGPLYYSFNKGRVHYLMLDNIYVGAAEAYAAFLDPVQLEWVMKDLALVEEGSPVVVCAHQPVTWTETSRAQNAALLAQLNKYNTLILSAHKHLGMNLDKYYDNIEERIQTALCGAYWFGDCAKDGIDLGYYIYDMAGDRITWEYKPLKRQPDTSIRINDPVRNADGSYTFLVNLFDWDSNWTVNYSLDGEDMGTPTQVEKFDPHAELLYSEHVKAWCRPVATRHMFEIITPASARRLDFSGTDRFGNTIRQSYDIAPEEIPDRADMAIKGFVRANGTPVEGVVVTNGYDFTSTNIFGIYYLPYNQKAEMVYIVTPAGYDPAIEGGLPKFFHHIQQTDGNFQADFNLIPTGDDTRHAFLAIGDPQMRDDHDYRIFETQAYPDIAATLEKLADNGTPHSALVLGDICFNSCDTYPRYLSTLEGTETPFYHIPGNHDKQIVTTPGAAEHAYKSHFGPLYYSFNKGKIHYLMLDNINITAAGAYQTAVSDDAAAWITKDLAMVPKDMTLVVCVHQPITFTKSSADTNKDLLVTFSKYKTLILSAHKHFAQNLGKYSLSAAPDADIEERIHTALCGAYWFGDVAKDGTPLGYYLYEVDGSDISWKFKPLGDDDFSQIKIHTPSPFGSRLKVDVNVFDYDSNWIVTWKLDGSEKGRMYNYEALDPHANELYANHEKSWCRPTLTKHMFYGYLPADFSSIEVNATDRFGRTHTCRYASSGITSAEVRNFHIGIDNRRLYVASDIEVRQIEISSVTGTLCVAVAATTEADLSVLAPGVYVVKLIMADGRRVVEKIMLN